MTLTYSEMAGSGAAQPTRELTGKTALVTGAARGTGAAAAVELAERGANVVASRYITGEVIDVAAGANARHMG